MSDQLNLAHLAEKYEKEETKTNLRQCPLNSVQVQDPWRKGVWEQSTQEAEHEMTSQAAR